MVQVSRQVDMPVVIVVLLEFDHIPLVAWQLLLDGWLWGLRRLFHHFRQPLMLLQTQVRINIGERWRVCLAMMQKRMLRRLFLLRGYLELTFPILQSLIGIKYGLQDLLSLVLGSVCPRKFESRDQNRLLLWGTSI